LPVIIREMDDYMAANVMVDTNFEQREKLLHSEKAWSYWIKMQALGHKGIKDEKQSVEILMEQTGESRSQIFRFIRLTELIVELMDKVDTKQLAFNPAVELSYLPKPKQKLVLSVMEDYDMKPSHSQALQLKKLAQADGLTCDEVVAVLSENKSRSKADGGIDGIGQYRKFFPRGYTLEQMDKVIVELLQEWQPTRRVKSKPA